MKVEKESESFKTPKSNLPPLQSSSKIQIKEEISPVTEVIQEPVSDIPKTQQVTQKPVQESQNNPEKEHIEEKIVKKDFEIEQIVLQPDNPKESESLEELRKLVENTLGMGLTHTHAYTGDRQWNDQKCPICRTKAQKVVFETKEQISNKEKLNDKAIMTLALEIDKELLRKAKVLYSI